MGINNIKTYEGKLVSENIKVGIVAARFNEFITSSCWPEQSMD